MLSSILGHASGLIVLALLFKPFFKNFKSFYKDFCDLLNRKSRNVDIWGNMSGSLKVWLWLLIGLLSGSAVYFLTDFLVS